MNILITGGAGFIGSNLTEKLLERGDTVMIIDNFNSYYNSEYKRENIRMFLKTKNFRLAEGDISNSNFLTDIFNKGKFEKVVHLAASVGVRNSLEYPKLYYENNVQRTKTLLDIVVKNNVSQFIFAS